MPVVLFWCHINIKQTINVIFRAVERIVSFGIFHSPSSRISHHLTKKTHSTRQNVLSIAFNNSLILSLITSQTNHKFCSLVGRSILIPDSMLLSPKPLLSDVFSRGDFNGVRSSVINISSLSELSSRRVERFNFFLSLGDHRSLLDEDMSEATEPLRWRFWEAFE